MNNTATRTRTRTLVLLSILTAVVIILQFMGSFLRIGPFSVSLVLLPIVIGTATCGAIGGAWLGLVFGGMVLLSGDAGPFLAVNAAGTILTVLAKGILCGLISGLVYKGLEKYNRYSAVVVAAIVCPVVNTGIFLLGTKLFFMETITQWAVAAGFASVGKFIIYGLVGGNFVFELLLNIVLSPVIVRLLNIRKG